MDHKVYYDAKASIIRMDIVGPFGIKDAEESIKILDDLLKDGRGNHLLADLNQSPNLTVDRETRRMLQEKGKDLVFDKMAVIGASPVTRMIAKVVMSVLGRSSSVRFFSAEKEALAWFAKSNGGVSTDSKPNKGE